MKTDFPLPGTRACRSKRMDEIVEILAREPFLSMREIGQRVGLKKTPWLREMMIELVGQERVVYDWTETPQGLRVMVFRVFHHEQPDPPAELYDENEDYLPYITDDSDLEGPSLGDIIADRIANAPEDESGFPSVFIDPSNKFPF